jgi:hypothetical protein
MQFKIKLQGGELMNKLKFALMTTLAASLFFAGIGSASAATSPEAAKAEKREQIQAKIAVKVEEKKAQIQAKIAAKAAEKGIPPAQIEAKKAELKQRIAAQIEAKKTEIKERIAQKRAQK